MRKRTIAILVATLTSLATLGLTVPAGASGPPGQVTNVTTTVHRGNVSIHWTNGSGTNGANVYMDGTKVFSWGWPYDYNDFTQWTDVGVPKGSHTFTIADYNSSGEGPQSTPATAVVTQKNKPPVTKNPPAGSAALGFYIDGDDPANQVALGKQLGVVPTVYTMYTDGSSWSSISNDSSGWQRHDQPANMTLALSVNMCINDSAGEDMAAAANNLATYTALGQSVVNAGWKNTIYRLGWESSGNWGGGGYCWTQQGSQRYKTTFRLIEGAIKQSDPSAVFDWNIGYGADGVHFQNGQTYTSWYPGNKYVNIISTDEYNNCYPASTVDHTLLNGYDVAAHYGKPWALPEWGGGCSQDSTAFMQNMVDMILGVPTINGDTGQSVTTVPPAYQSYFWANGAELTNFPNSEKIYEQAFG